MASLVVVGGPSEGQKFALANHNLVMIGRDHTATFQIMDGRMSRHHAQVKRRDTDDGHSVIDFDSANGVYVNDERIASETPLADGDVVRIGRSLIMYSVADDPDAQDISQVLRRHGQRRHETQIDTPNRTPQIGES